MNLFALILLFLPVFSYAYECEPMVYRVEGVSMEPVIHNNSYIFINPLSCYKNKLTKGDIILLHNGADKNPLIKKIYAISGDNLKLIADKNYWHIYVNNVPLANSMGDIYTLSEKRSKMLKLYEGLLPENTFLVLGEAASGTKDSSRFGLVHISDIIGIKVEHEK